MTTEQYSSRIQFYTDEVPHLLSSYLEGTEWKKCLELGCGDGALLHALNEQGYLGHKAVFAVDISASRMGTVKTINKDFGCIIGDACSSPIQDGSIDFLISTQVIEHVGDDEEMVKEMRRIVCHNGIVYLATVFKKWYGWYFYRCNGKWTLDPTHVREYNQDSQLLGMLEKHGFEVLENKKALDGRPVMDSLLRRIGAPRTVYNNPILRQLRKLRVPIPGYYIWELVCKKEEGDHGGNHASV